MEITTVGSQSTLVTGSRQGDGRLFSWATVRSAISNVRYGQRETVIALQNLQHDPVFWTTWPHDAGKPNTYDSPCAQLYQGPPTYVRLHGKERIFAWSPIGKETQIIWWEAGAQPAFEQSGFLSGFKNRRVPAKSDKRSKMWRAQGEQCALCRRQWPEHLISEMTVDHIMPLSKGGDNSDGNLQLTCLTCNASKKDMDNDDAKEILPALVNMPSDSARAQAIKKFREVKAREPERSDTG